ncbi:MAG: galactose ABC transporter substrate-binding protein, partial [Bacillota bacterium]
MKKLLALLTVSALILTACGGSKSSTGSSSSSSGSASGGKPKIGVTIYKYDDNFMSFVRRA